MPTHRHTVSNLNTDFKHMPHLSYVFCCFLRTQPIAAWTWISLLPTSSVISSCISCSHRVLQHQQNLHFRRLLLAVNYPSVSDDCGICDPDISGRTSGCSGWKEPQGSGSPWCLRYISRWYLSVHTKNTNSRTQGLCKLTSFFSLLNRLALFPSVRFGLILHGVWLRWLWWCVE